MIIQKNVMSIWLVYYSHYSYHKMSIIKFVKITFYLDFTVFRNFLIAFSILNENYWKIH